MSNLRKKNHEAWNDYVTNDDLVGVCPDVHYPLPDLVVGDRGL